MSMDNRSCGHRLGYVYHERRTVWPNEWRPPHDHPINRYDPLPISEELEAVDITCNECHHLYEQWKQALQGDLE